MSIVILVGGTSEHGNVEHRYLVTQMLQRFGDGISHIVTRRPPERPVHKRLQSMLKRGNFKERFARARFSGGYGPEACDLQPLLLPDETTAHMPGGDKVVVVSSHNGDDCQALIEAANPKVVVVYGTAIIRGPVLNLASQITLNMHTGLSPYYRGDSTLFWPVYYDDPSHLGVTIHKLAESVDGGDIAATARVDYEKGDTEAHLFAKAVKAGTSLYLKAVEDALEGSVKLTPQDLSTGREFRWQHRTVAAEHRVAETLSRWNQAA